jgi:hypothetical protein
MKYWHKRVYVVSFYDLSEEQQAETLATYDEQAEELTYLVHDDDFLWPLNEFMRVQDSRYHAVATVTNTSAIGLILSPCGETGIVQCFG